MGVHGICSSCYFAIQSQAAVLQGLDKLVAGMEEGEGWASLYSKTDIVVGTWLSHARRLLQELTAPKDGKAGAVMAIVTLGELIPTFAKLLLFRINVCCPPLQGLKSFPSDPHLLLQGP